MPKVRCALTREAAVKPFSVLTINGPGVQRIASGQQSATKPSPARGPRADAMQQAQAEAIADLKKSRVEL